MTETDSAGITQATYTYGDDLISMNRAGANSHYHYDGLGSTRQLTDSLGGVTVTYTYDGFGNLIASTGTSDNTYGFTGEQQFGEADNLVFLRARCYDPRIGRFISRDPILGPMRMESNFVWFLPYLIYYPQDLYSYVYVANNPVNRVDPRGLGFGDVWDCIKKALECSEVNTPIDVIGVIALYASCVAGCGAVTGGAGVGPCLYGCLAAVVGGHAAGLILACL